MFTFSLFASSCSVKVFCLRLGSYDIIRAYDLQQSLSPFLNVFVLVFVLIPIEWNRTGT